jgi:hypothetical protein
MPKDAREPHLLRAADQQILYVADQYLLYFPAKQPQISQQDD